MRPLGVDQSRRALLLTGSVSAAAWLLMGHGSGSGAAVAAALQHRDSGNPASPTISLFTDANRAKIPVGINAVRTSGYRQHGRGMALYDFDAAIDAAHVRAHPLTSFIDGNGRGFRLSLNQALDPFMAGATGKGDERLYSTTYVSDIAPGTPVTLGTRDGLAINAILRLLREGGGGVLHIPAGEFRTYGYLERIDFPLRIIGAGRGVAMLRNCRSSPTDRNGYGIFIILPQVVTPIRIEKLTLDGRAAERPAPRLGKEYRNFPLAVNGQPQIMLDDCAFINSPIDCLRTGYANGNMSCWLEATNCLFSSSFRNTVSMVSGWNQRYSNCTIEKGGLVHGGTNPRYAVDIEPGRSHETIKNISLSNCIIREAKNALVGGVWAGNVRFSECLFQAYGGRKASGSAAAYPWFTVVRGGEFTFDRCTFDYLGGDYQGRLHFPNPLKTGEYAESQFTRLDDCRVSGAGIDGYGLHMELNDVTVQNSRRPVIFRGNGTQNLRIQNMRLINVFDAVNVGAGHEASFVIHDEVEGDVSVENVDVLVEAARIPADFDLSLVRQFGISIGSSHSAKRSRLSGLRSEGYDRQLPNYLGIASNSGKFRGRR